MTEGYPFELIFLAFFKFLLKWCITFVMQFDERVCLWMFISLCFVPHEANMKM